MPEATQRRMLRYKSVPFIISIIGAASALSVNGKPISVGKLNNNRYHTRSLPHAEYKDMEALAHALIEAYPSVRK